MKGERNLLDNRIEIFDNKRMVLDGIESITGFGDGFIIFKFPKYSLKVSANEIKISEFTDTTAFLEGELFSVEFLYI